VVTVRVEEPAVAVIVTDVAFVACQFNVTLCPALIELALAEKTRVGFVELPDSPTQEQSPHKAIGIVP